MSRQCSYPIPTHCLTSSLQPTFSLIIEPEYLNFSTCFNVYLFVLLLLQVSASTQLSRVPLRLILCNYSRGLLCPTLHKLIWLPLHLSGMAFYIGVRIGIRSVTFQKIHLRFLDATQNVKFLKCVHFVPIKKPENCCTNDLRVECWWNMLTN